MAFRGTTTPPSVQFVILPFSEKFLALFTRGSLCNIFSCSASPRSAGFKANRFCVSYCHAIWTSTDTGSRNVGSHHDGSKDPARDDGSTSREPFANRDFHRTSHGCGTPSGPSGFVMGYGQYSQRALRDWASEYGAFGVSNLRRG